MRDRKSDAHRKAGERKAGRKLGRNDIVHHRDEDKTNNSPDNLEIEERGKHTATHNRHRGLSKLRKALRMMMQKGEGLY